jgi:hypothetical protein
MKGELLPWIGRESIVVQSFAANRPRPKRQRIGDRDLPCVAVAMLQQRPARSIVAQVIRVPMNGVVRPFVAIRLLMPPPPTRRRDASSIGSVARGSNRLRARHVLNRETAHRVRVPPATALRAPARRARSNARLRAPINRARTAVRAVLILPRDRLASSAINQLSHPINAAISAALIAFPPVACNVRIQSLVSTARAALRLLRMSRYSVVGAPSLAADPGAISY